MSNASSVADGRWVFGGGCQGTSLPRTRFFRQGIGLSCALGCVPPSMRDRLLPPSTSQGAWASAARISPQLGRGPGPRFWRCSVNGCDPGLEKIIVVQRARAGGGYGRAMTSTVGRKRPDPDGPRYPRSRGACWPTVWCRSGVAHASRNVEDGGGGSQPHVERV